MEFDEDSIITIETCLGLIKTTVDDFLEKSPIESKTTREKKEVSN